MLRPAGDLLYHARALIFVVRVNDHLNAFLALLKGDVLILLLKAGLYLLQPGISVASVKVAHEQLRCVLIDRLIVGAFP